LNDVPADYFVSYTEAHTGESLAKVLHSVWGIVCDNASNNGSMMKELGKYDLKRLKGPESRVHCVLHVINLAAKVSVSYAFYLTS
ncbi:hypothetical protein BDV93DRAFT_457694, partial [Ceratobasidium sp. AG-I]